ncbi:phage holin family protein [Candidatus Uhrbacteria bacterium]|nr:phage holin family protein [Candidatus Uhrbacteria bacterium]
MYLLLRLFLNALTVMLVAYLVPGVLIKDFPHAFFAAVVIGLVNALIRPVLRILSLPITIITLGLFTLIINALMFWLASKLSPGFTIVNFSSAFWGGLIFWLVSWVTNGLIRGSKRT